MTQSQTGELLDRATADLRPSTDLVAGAVAAGRRRRRRGLAVTAAGTLAAAAVAGAAVLSLPGSGSGSGHTVVADPTGTAGTSYAAQPSAPPVDQTPPSDAGPFPVAPDAMASTLATLVSGPVTGTKNDQYHLDAPGGWQSGAVEVDGGTVSVSIQHSTGPRCDGDLDRGNRDCTALGGGFFTSTYSAEVTTVDGRTGVHDIGVTYYTPDGIKINATAANAGLADPGHPTSDQPVLGLDALTTIAESPVWLGQ
jgi:hypothetical protein